jgi:hypothetical protein
MHMVNTMSIPCQYQVNGMFAMRCIFLGSSGISGGVSLDHLIFGWVYKVKVYILATQYRKKLESFTPLTVALKAYGSIRIKSTFQGVTI